MPPFVMAVKAEIDGNCSASINGVDARSRSSTNTSNAIVVKEHTAVPVVMQSSNSLSRARVQLEFGGFRWTVKDEPTSGTSYQDTVPIDKYARYGVGLYKVIGQTIGPAGTCSGAVLVRVMGNPLNTVAGGAALGVAAVGTAGVLAASAASAFGGGGASAKFDSDVSKLISETPEKTDLRQRYEQMREKEEEEAELRYQRSRDMTNEMIDVVRGACFFFALPALLLTGLAMASGGPRAPKEPILLRRAGWRPRISFVGMVGGVLAGAGGLVLLQQYAVAYPTRTLAIELLVGGLALGVVLPSLLRVFAVGRVNRVIARAERRINEARERQQHPPSTEG